MVVVVVGAAMKCVYSIKAAAPAARTAMAGAPVAIAAPPVKGTVALGMGAPVPEGAPVGWGWVPLGAMY